SLLQTIINELLSADADAVVGAEYGRPSAGRTAQRNGYRHRRPRHTRRHHRRRRPQTPHRHLLPRMAPRTAQTRRIRVDHRRRRLLPGRRPHPPHGTPAARFAMIAAGGTPKLVTTLGINSLSESQVSRMATDLD